MKSTTKAIIPQQTIIFADTELHLIPDQHLDFLLTNSEVAEGYGVKINQLTQARTNHPDELIEGKHWMRRTVQTNGGKQKVICWSKRGIIRLGFFIRSERAKKFRDFIEDLTLGYFDGCKADAQMTPRIMAYKANLSKKNKQIEELRFKLALYQEEVRQLKDERNRMIDTAKTFEKLLDKEKAVKRFIEHNLLDLTGELARHNELLKSAATTLEIIAKDLHQSADHANLFLDNILKYYPKAKDNVERIRKHFRRFYG